MTKDKTHHYLFQAASPGEARELQRLLRANPMDGWIRLGLEQSASCFGGTGLMGPSVSVIARENNREKPAAMYTAEQLPVMIDGRSCHGLYLGGLRIDPAFRGRLGLLREGYASIRELTPFHAAGPWFTSIAADNHAARRLLERGLPGLPRYTPLGELETLAISTRRGKSGKLLHQANPSDASRIARFYNARAKCFQFTPHLDAAWLLRIDGENGLHIEDFWLAEQNGEIIACVAIWDQRAIKRTMVHGYREPLQQLRPLYNIYAGLGGRPILPRPGTPLEAVFLAFLAWDPAHVEPVTLLREALSLTARRNAKLALLGLSAKHPQLGSIKQAFRPECYRTVIETVTWEDESTQLPSPAPVQPEIALL